MWYSMSKLWKHGISKRKGKHTSNTVQHNTCHIYLIAYIRCVSPTVWTLR